MTLQFSMKCTALIILSVIVAIIPVQLQIQDELKRNSVEGSQLNECLSGSQRSQVGVCFGKELLNTLNDYDEADTFSLATGITFVRDENMPRDIRSFLDKDPMDFRSIMEDASNLISKRSLHWDLSRVYPGLVLRIGPTLANGILEFVIDPRIKDRSSNQGEMTTGRLLKRNLLVPFLLGIKFHITTLLPLLLGLLLLASKKAFLLAKLALVAVTLFSAGSSFGGNYFEHYESPTSAPTTTTTSTEHFGHYHGHHPGGYWGHRHNHPDDFYKEKSDETPTAAAPITPDELRDRLERLFITKKGTVNDPGDEIKIRNARNFAWTPINGG